jgi:hypothetical protein
MNSAPIARHYCFFFAGDGLAFGSPAFAFVSFVCGEAFAAGDAEAAGEAELCGDAAVFAAGDVNGEPSGTGVGEAAGALCVSRTERVPEANGSDMTKAISINAAAAPIVIFDKSVCVPRGPKAVVEIEFVNRAPASALPGCKRIETIKTTHAITNNV